MGLDRAFAWFEAHVGLPPTYAIPLAAVLAFFFVCLVAERILHHVFRWRMNRKIRMLLDATDDAVYHEPADLAAPSVVKLPNGQSVWVDDCECGGYRVRSPWGPDWFCNNCGWSHDYATGTSSERGDEAAGLEEAH